MLVKIFGHIIDFAIHHDPARLAGVVLGDFETIDHRHCNLSLGDDGCVGSKKSDQTTSQLWNEVGV